MICRVLGSPEVRWHRVLWAAVIGQKTSVTSQKKKKSAGISLTSTQPLVAVKSELLANVKCDHQAWWLLLAPPRYGK